MTKPVYTRPVWAECQLTRRDGRVEDVCKHGVGHPNLDWLGAHPDMIWASFHGCDGCCSPMPSQPPANRPSNRDETPKDTLDE